MEMIGLKSLVFAAALFCSCASGAQAPQQPSSMESEDMSSSSHVHHGIDYIEFTVTDMAEAKRFYGAAFDWTFTDYGPDYMGIQKPGGGESGGMALGATVTGGGPLVVLYSSDLEATVASVKSAGGRVVKEPFAFPGGRRFHFQDPAGNELAVWSE
jgi:predicted enzyme related to lactoylglutathione lyase